MSCYEWESGTITLPQAAVPGLRAALNAAATRRRSMIVDEVHALFDRIKDVPAARRVDEIPNYVTLPRGDAAGFRRAQAVGDAQCFLHSTKAHRPTKAALERAFPTPTSRTCHWQENEFSLTLDGRQLHWDVAENNRARDDAEQTLLYDAAVKYLNSITWTRGSGGVIVGNDEYNRDDSTVGGGGNYVTREFGPHVPRPRPSGW